MQHYVVILDWAIDDNEGVSVIGVGHTEDEAKEIFNAQLRVEREYVKEHEWHVFSNSDTCYDAGVEGYYASDHCHLFIEEV